VVFKVSRSERNLLTKSSVLEEIISQAVATPDQPAAVDLARELSFSELIDEVSRLAAGLGTRGVKEGDRVALFLSNSVDFIVAALATLWVGAVFVPLAVTDPPSRLRTICEDSGPGLIIASVRSAESTSETFGDIPVLAIGELLEESGIPVTESITRSRAAYIIYTSGTTGTPKGVQIGTMAFAAAVHSTVLALGLTSDTRTLCVSPFHFDGSYDNVFPTLVSGGTIVIRARESLLFPRTFFKTVANEGITYSGFTPSYLRLLLSSPQFSMLSESQLELVALGGEALTVADVRALWSHLPNLRVFNRYGPTETTIAVTNFELTPEMIAKGTVPIGTPHPGVTFVLVGDDGKVINAANQTGELCIGGVQLMEGYWAEPVLTSQVMRDDIVPGETLYRTGDLVYRNDDGNYVYVDRVDRVVKRSGVRISLVELSESLNKVPGVTAATCLAFDRDGELGIAGFVASDATLSVIDIRRAASKLIPENMLPDRFVFVSEMPLGRSNMLDEARLLSEAGLRPFRPTSTLPLAPA
jgi:D-alanine--poly(phosphoribitol) ligase subunit 1